MGNVQTAASAHDVPWRQTPSGDLVDLGRPFRAPLALSRLQSTPKPILGRREAILLGALALVFHGAVIYWLSQNPTPALPVVQPEIPPMTIEFSQPAPPVVETPPPPPREMVGSSTPSAPSPKALMTSQHSELKSWRVNRSFEAEVKSCKACAADVLPLLLAPTNIEISDARSMRVSFRRRKLRTQTVSICISFRSLKNSF